MVVSPGGLCQGLATLNVGRQAVQRSQESSSWTTLVFARCPGGPYALDVRLLVLEVGLSDILFLWQTKHSLFCQKS